MYISNIKSDTCNQQPEIMSQTELQLRKRVSYFMKFDKVFVISLLHNSTSNFNL